MITAIRKRLEDREEGFTLIELLVVVIIIGILAVIAIPTFLNQRQRGWVAALQSDLRNAAIAQESVFTTTSAYVDDDNMTDGTGLDGAGFNQSPGVTVTTISAGATAYCMSATHTNLTGRTFYISSASGTPSETACT